MADIGMNDLDELLGAYALDAVTDDERRVVDHYLVSNPRARAEVEQHREVATMLAFSGASAPDGLWELIADQINDEKAPRPGPELAKVIPMSAARGWMRRAGTLVAAAAAAAAVAVVATNLVRSDGPSNPLAAALADARNDRDSRLASFDLPQGGEVEAVIDQDGHGYIQAAALPELPADKTYQLWGVVGRPGGDDQVISFGIVGRNPEIETFSGAADLKAIVVTIENEGGVLQDGNLDGAVPLEFA